MKKLILAASLSVTLLCGPTMLLMQSGCTTSQQTITYKTLYSVEVSTQAAVNGYYDLVLKGQVKTNGVPAVSKAFNEFQAVMDIAVQLNEKNTNAPAPAAVLTKSTALINLINQEKSK